MATMDNFLKSVVPAIYYDKTFLDVLEDHLTYFVEHPQTTVVSVTPSQADIYQGDLVGLCSALNVMPQLNYLVMRMNGFHTYTDNDETLTQLLIPDYATVDRLAQIQNSTLQKQASSVQ